VEKQVGTGPDQRIIRKHSLYPRVKKVLAFAVKEARALNHTYVGTKHILLGCCVRGMRRRSCAQETSLSISKKPGKKSSRTRSKFRKMIPPSFSHVSRFMHHSNEIGASLTAPSTRLASIPSPASSTSPALVSIARYRDRSGGYLEGRRISQLARTTEKLNLPVISLPFTASGLIDFPETGARVPY